MSRVTVALAGDVMLGRGVHERLGERGPDWPWGDLLPGLRQADAFLVNLECALTPRTTRWRDGAGKLFHFRADPRHVEALTRARVAFAGLANNHVGDFGMAGLLDTVAALDRAGIRHAGAGRDLDAARRPALLAAGDLGVAVVAAADHPAEWAAADDRPGLFHVAVSDDEAAIAPVATALAEARRRARFVVFSCHWGPNMRDRPTPEFRRFARRVLEAGADVFWGHSAHVAQGIEVVDGRPILYDTGDFVDDYAVDADLRNDLSALFLLRIEEGLVSRVDLLPVRIADGRVDRARGEDRALLRELMAARCAALGTPLIDRGPAGLLGIAVGPRSGVGAG